MRKLTEVGEQRRMPPSRLRVAVVGVALVIPALLTLANDSRTISDRIVLCVLMLAMTAAAVLRIAQALQTAESSEARLVFQANHDSLTGLPNRRMMEQHLADLLAEPAIDDTHVAVLYLDLDRFKLINDTLGHSHGDELLIEVAERLHANVRPSDLVTRIGGDEFMIILGHVVSVSQAVDLANRLRSCLRTPFIVHGMTFYVSASIGLAFASGDDRNATAEALVRDADTAMYQAKDAGRDAVSVFDESMRERMAERVELERDLRFALSHEPAPPRLSAHRAPAPRERRGHGGAGALVAPHTRRHLAREVHPAGRRERARSRRSATGCSKRPSASSRPGATRCPR